MKTYTNAELNEIGRNTLVNYKANNRITYEALKMLRQLHYAEYMRIRKELRKKLIPNIRFSVRDQDCTRLGRHVVEKRQKMAETRKLFKETSNRG